MNWKNTENHYGKVSIAFHWLMVILLIAVFATIELRVMYPKGSDPREEIKALHFMLGMVVFYNGLFGILHFSIEEYFQGFFF